MYGGIIVLKITYFWVALHSVIENGKAPEEAATSIGRVGKSD
jgi:hypothetical protein